MFHFISASIYINSHLKYLFCNVEEFYIFSSINSDSHPIYRVKVLECSAKDEINIKEIFRTFLTLSRIFPKDAEDSGGLKRRSSAYVSASKGGRRAVSPAPEDRKSVV